MADEVMARDLCIVCCCCSVPKYFSTQYWYRLELLLLCHAPVLGVMQTSRVMLKRANILWMHDTWKYVGSIRVIFLSLSLFMKNNGFISSSCRGFSRETRPTKCSVIAVIRHTARESVPGMLHPPATRNRENFCTLSARGVYGLGGGRGNAMSRLAFRWGYGDSCALGHGSDEDHPLPKLVDTQKRGIVKVWGDGMWSSCVCSFAAAAVSARGGFCSRR